MTPLVKGAAKVLAARSVVPPVDDGSERARGIATIERAMRERALRARRRRLGFAAIGVVSLAAAAAAAMMLVHGERAPSTLTARAPTLAADAVTMTATSADADVTLSDGLEAAHPLAPNAPVRVGSRIVAARGAHAMLGFSTGTSFDLDGSDVVILDASSTERFDLRDGAIAAKVSHLAPGRRLVVQTPDAEVEVRGTTFRVTVLPVDGACADGTRTSVVVTEGVVVVRARTHGSREERVEAGGSWPPACHGAQAAASAPPPSATATSAASSASTLTAQNDLFADAMTAKRSGDKRRAVATLDELIAKYPRGPLVESSEAERLRLLRDVDPARATVEARAYLRRYPRGFARDEAQAILAP